MRIYIDIANLNVRHGAVGQEKWLTNQEFSGKMNTKK